MTSLPTSLRDALEDPVVQGIPLQIYVRCWLWLEPYRHRPLPGHVVARDLRIKRDFATRSLDLLVEHGYLERGPNAEHGIRTYRLLVTRYVRAS